MEANDEEEDKEIHELFVNDLNDLKTKIKQEKFDETVYAKVGNSISDHDVPSTSRGVAVNDGEVDELFVDNLQLFKTNIKKEILEHENVPVSIANHDVPSTSQSSQPFDAGMSCSTLVQPPIKEELVIKEETLDMESADDSLKETMKKFQVDRSAIPEIAKSEQASELQGLEGLSVYNQETFEAAILKQVDNALTGGSQTDEVDQQTEDAENEASFPLLDIGRSGETDMERSIRLGEMTPFGTTLQDQTSKRTEPKEKGDLKDVIQGLEKYFENQEKMTRKQNNRKRDAQKEKSVAPLKKPKLGQGKNPLDRKVLNRDGNKKKRKKKENLGTKTAKDNDDTPGTVCGEDNYFHKDDTGSEYAPSSDGEWYSSGMAAATISDIIVELKQKPFSLLSFEEKMLIVENGRPSPVLSNLTTEVTDNKKTYTRHFTTSNYDSYNWLCGSKSLNRLFCWPCFLFSCDKNVWRLKGFNNLGGLSRSEKAHEKSERHLQSVLDLYNFKRQRVHEGINNTLKVDHFLHNQKVEKNREVLKRLIDVTCFLAKQQLPFRRPDESESSLNKGNFIETLNLLKKWDPTLSEHFETAAVFKETFIDIQNELITIINDIVIKAVQQEVQNASFVSIMLDETCDVRKRSQLSTILRFVKENGCIEERFVGFTDVSADRSADGLLVHIKSIVKAYKLVDKFVAQTYDGAAVMSVHLTGV